MTKFQKRMVLYSSTAPPPLVYDYRCKHCELFEKPSGCKIVEGTICSEAWCILWIPRHGSVPFKWIKEWK